MQDHGLYLLGLHLNREDWCTLATARIAQNLHLSVFADGSHWEQSPLYHCEVLQCVLDVLWAAKQNNRTLPAEIGEKAHAMCRALRIWLKPNGHLLLQSDSDDVDLSIDFFQRKCLTATSTISCVPFTAQSFVLFANSDEPQRILT